MIRCQPFQVALRVSCLLSVIVGAPTFAEHRLKELIELVGYVEIQAALIIRTEAVDDPGEQMIVVDRTGGIVIAVGIERVAKVGKSNRGAHAAERQKSSSSTFCVSASEGQAIEFVDVMMLSIHDRRVG